MIESNQVTDAAFDWLKILKFRMDIRNILRAKTVMTDTSTTASSAASPTKSPTKTPRGQMAKMAQRKDSKGIEE